MLKDSTEKRINFLHIRLIAWVRMKVTLTGAINVYSRLNTDNTMPYDFPASENGY
jgi:hypothetical protein